MCVKCNMCVGNRMSSCDRPSWRQKSFLRGIEDRAVGKPITCVPWDPEGEVEELTDVYTVGYDPYGEIVRPIDTNVKAEDFSRCVFLEYDVPFPTYAELRRTNRCHWPKKKKRVRKGAVEEKNIIVYCLLKDTMAVNAFFRELSLLDGDDRYDCVMKSKYDEINKRSTGMLLGSLPCGITALRHDEQEKEKEKMVYDLEMEANKLRLIAWAVGKLTRTLTISIDAQTGKRIVSKNALSCMGSVGIVTGGKGRGTLLVDFTRIKKLQLDVIALILSYVTDGTSLATVALCAPRFYTAARCVVGCWNDECTIGLCLWHSYILTAALAPLLTVQQREKGEERKWQKGVLAERAMGDATLVVKMVLKDHRRNLGLQE